MISQKLSRLDFITIIFSATIAGSVVGAVFANVYVRNSNNNTLSSGGIINVTHYCSTHDISHDISDCAQRAIHTAATKNPSFGGGKVYFPASHSPYILRGTLVLDASFVSIVGDGTQSSFINCLNADTDCIVIGGLQTPSRDQTIENIGVFADSMKTAGANIRIQNTFNVRIERVQIENCIICFDIGPGTNATTLRDVIATPNQPASKYGIYWHAPGDGSQRNDVLTLHNIVVEGQWSNATGLQWEGFSNTLVATHFRVLHSNYGIRIINPSASKEYFPSFMNAFDLELEGFKIRALSIEAGEDFKIEGSDINNLSSRIQGEADDVAIQILSDSNASITRGVQISNSRIGNCQSNGLWSDARDVQLSNVMFFSTSLAGPGAAAAIRLGSESRDVQLFSVKAEEFGGRGFASFGLQIDSGASYIQAVGFNAAYVRKGAILGDRAGSSITLTSIIEPDGTVWSHPLNLRKGPNLNSSKRQTTTEPSEGDCDWEQENHKLVCYDGKAWRSAW